MIDKPPGPGNWYRYDRLTKGFLRRPVATVNDMVTTLCNYDCLLYCFNARSQYYFVEIITQLKRDENHRSYFQYVVTCDGRVVATVCHKEEPPPVSAWEAINIAARYCTRPYE